MEAGRKRFNNIDLWRAIAAFLVVAIHCPFPGALGEAVANVGRIAVPFFFIVSGFFCYSEDADVNRKKAVRQIKTILGIVLIFLARKVAIALGERCKNKTEKLKCQEHQIL